MEGAMLNASTHCLILRHKIKYHDVDRFDVLKSTQIYSSKPLDLAMCPR